MYAHLPTQVLGAELKNAGVNVFGTVSKKESLILTLPDIQQARRAPPFAWGLT